MKNTNLVYWAVRSGGVVFVPSLLPVTLVTSDECTVVDRWLRSSDLLLHLLNFCVDLC